MFALAKKQFEGLITRVNNLENLIYRQEQRIRDLTEEVFRSEVKSSARTPVNKLTVNVSIDNPTYYINDEGYAVVIEQAISVPVGGTTLFLFRGRYTYTGGSKENKDAGYYTEDGQPVSFFGYNGYEKHTPLYMPECVPDALSND